MKTCANCIYRERLVTEEPCLECLYDINWEGEDDQEDSDNDNQ